MNFDCAHIWFLKTIKLTLVIYLFINLCIEIFIRYGKNEFCLLTKYPLVYDFSILGDACPAQLHCLSVASAQFFFCIDLSIIYLIFFFSNSPRPWKKTTSNLSWVSWILFRIVSRGCLYCCLCIWTSQCARMSSMIISLISF